MKSYTLLLFLWLVTGLTSQVFSQCANIHPDDLAGLRGLYKYAHGDQWTENDGWDQIVSNRPIRYCDLDNIFGLEFSTGKVRRVIEINLHNNNGSGELPTELGGMSHLQDLVLTDNNIAGKIPKSLGNLHNLKNLALRYNAFTGTIPEELGNLTSLQRLSLYSNQLTGSIPKELGNIGKNLWFLALNQNRLTGVIPKSLCQLTSLEFLLLQRNNLEGSLPPALGDLQDLIILSAYQNNLTGPIPTSIGNCTELQTIRISKNQISGVIPSSIGNLFNLEYFNAQENNLVGAIPREMGQLSSLRTAYLGSNQLKGTIPGTLGNLSNLELLYLHFNNISGCLDQNLLNLCGADVSIDDAKFEAPWPTFCSSVGKIGGCRNSRRGAADSQNVQTLLVENNLTVQCYPNPVHDNLRVDLERIISGNILIQNVNGQIVHEHDFKDEEQLDINCRHLCAGIYVIRINSPDGVRSGKILVD